MSYVKSVIVSTMFLSFVGLPTFSLAGVRCESVLATLANGGVDLIAATAGMDPVQRMLVWEQQGNLSRYRQPSEPVQLQVARVPGNRTLLRSVEALPEFIKNQFILPNGDILVPTHPRNTSKDIPWNDVPASLTMTAFYTASRTMAIGNTGVKMGTSKPTPSEFAPNKADLRNSVKLSIARGRVVERLENEIGQDARLVMLKDVLSVADVDTGNGFVLRDTSALADGNQWVPSTAFPYIGHSLAEINGTTYPELIKEQYAVPVGVAKALLILRYGLQMKFPHGQNTLKKFSRQLKADDIGALAVRDLSDTSFYKPVAEVIAPTELAADIAEGFKVYSSIETNWENSAYSLRMAEPGLRFDYVEVSLLGKAHDEAFIQTVESELGVRIPREPGRVDDTVDRYLSSDFGKIAIRNYHARLRQQRQQQQTPKAG